MVFPAEEYIFRKIYFRLFIFIAGWVKRTPTFYFTPLVTTLHIAEDNVPGPELPIMT